MFVFLFNDYKYVHNKSAGKNENRIVHQRSCSFSVEKTVKVIGYATVVVYNKDPSLVDEKIAFDVASTWE